MNLFDHEKEKENYFKTLVFKKIASKTLGAVGGLSNHMFQDRKEESQNWGFSAPF